MPNDQGWKDLGRDLHKLGINSTDIPKKLYAMGWRKTTDAPRKIGAVHSNTVILPHQSSALTPQEVATLAAATEAQRVPKHRK